MRTAQVLVISTLARDAKLNAVTAGHAWPALPLRDIPFDTHTGYFVSNKFEPQAPASFVALQDQKAFDEVFGAGLVLNDKSHQLPADAFDTKIVVAAITRSKAVGAFKVRTYQSLIRHWLCVRLAMCFLAVRSLCGRGAATDGSQHRTR